MNMNQGELLWGVPLAGLTPDEDKIVEITDFDGNEYDDLVDSIKKNSESSRSIGSFIVFDFKEIIRFKTHGKVGIKCYEGLAKDAKGRTWFLDILTTYRAYDIGMVAEDFLEKFQEKYLKPATQALTEEK